MASAGECCLKGSGSNPSGDSQSFGEMFFGASRFNEKMANIEAKGYYTIWPNFFNIDLECQ